MELGFEPSILATDISDSCLERAKRAIYPKKCLSNIPNHMIKRYFQKGMGKWEDHVRVKQHISKMIKFEKFNLLKDSPPSKIFDIIFCRNVMIYFDTPTKETVIHKLSKVLKQGGHFIIGGAESLSGLTHSLKYIEPSVYKKYRPRHSSDKNDRRPLYTEGLHKNWTSGRSGLGGSGFRVACFVLFPYTIDSIGVIK